MRRWLSILMSFLILLTSFRDVVSYVSFYFNQDYISQNLCINRNNPKMKCKGKCVLKNSLSENHKKEDNKTPNPQQKEPFVFIIPNIELKPKPHISHNFKKVLYTYQCTFYASDYLDKVFHPPILFSFS